MENYEPPFTITGKIVNQIGQISELLGRVEVTAEMDTNPRLRRENRIKTIHSSLAIENNSLSLSQVTAIMDGKRVLGPPSEIKEVENAFEAYNQLLSFDPYQSDDLLAAHRLLMIGLVKEAGIFRSGDVGVFRSDGTAVHVAPPAAMVAGLTSDLLDWIKQSDLHPLITSSIFHYEFEFIHPFADGNGRMGRMWQTLLLYKWKSIFAWLPIETIIKNRQSDYYQAIRDSTGKSDCGVFIEFLLQAILDTLTEVIDTIPTTNGDQTAQISLLLSKLGDETLSAKELMARVGLRHIQTFRKNYLMPALILGKIEPTIPDKPTSRHQKYRIVSKQPSHN